MQLQEAVKNTFDQLMDALQQLSPVAYSKPCNTLFGNTVGQHVRHIIELFQCLETGYASGLVNYEKRKRDKQIEGDKELACSLLQQIQDGLSRENKQLNLEACYDGQLASTITLSTNYDREVAYNLEHTIHHMALIRIGITELREYVLPEHFGVASATVKYRRQCAQ